MDSRVLSHNDHKNAWTNKVGGRTNLSADDIYKIWKEVEMSPTYPIVYRPSNGINF